MIRFVHCVRRRPEVSELEFRRFWQGAELDGLVQQIREVLQPLRIKRSLVLAISQNEELMREREGMAPCDGMLELWFENARQFDPVRDDPGYRELMLQMEALQSRYVDFSQSMRFFTEWEE
jgi:hypothetical protein